MKRNQKDSGNILIMLAIIVALAVAGFYLLRGKATPVTMYPNQQTGTSNQAIQSDSNLLQSASQDLDNTNVDGTIDPELNQNNADESTF